MIVDLKGSCDDFRASSEEYSKNVAEKVWDNIKSQIMTQFALLKSTEYMFDQIWVASNIGPLNKFGQLYLFKLIFTEFSKIHVVEFFENRKKRTRRIFSSIEEIETFLETEIEEFAAFDQIELCMSDKN